MRYTMPPSLAGLVDLEAFPIHEPASAGYVAAVDGARAGLGGLVRPEAVGQLNDEILERKHATHYSTQVMNPYFHTSFNPDYPADHPVNTFIERSSGFIPGDAWQRGCATDVLFRAPDVVRFIADCLGLGALYCYDDPLAGLTANIFDPGPAVHVAFRHQRLRGDGAGAACRRGRSVRVRAPDPLS